MHSTLILTLLSLDIELARASITFLAAYNNNKTARAKFQKRPQKVRKPQLWIWKSLTDGLIIINEVLCPTSISWHNSEDATTAWSGSRSPNPLDYTQALSDFMESNEASGDIMHYIFNRFSMSLDSIHPVTNSLGSREGLIEFEQPRQPNFSSSQIVAESSPRRLFAGLTNCLQHAYNNANCSNLLFKPLQAQEPYTSVSAFNTVLQKEGRKILRKVRVKSKTRDKNTHRRELFKSMRPNNRYIIVFQTHCIAVDLFKNLIYESDPNPKFDFAIPFLPIKGDNSNIDHLRQYYTEKLMINLILHFDELWEIEP